MNYYHHQVSEPKGYPSLNSPSTSNENLVAIEEAVSAAMFSACSSLLKYNKLLEKILIYP
jgi:hypothetical protein